MGEIDGLGSLRESVDAAAGVIVAFLEGGEGGGGGAFEAEGGDCFVEVEFGGGGALGGGKRLVMSSFVSIVDKKTYSDSHCEGFSNQLMISVDVADADELWRLP